MPLHRGFKLSFFTALTGYAVLLRSLEPKPGDLMDMRWHAEAPLRLVMRLLAWLLPRVYERYGESGVRALQLVFYQVGLDRAKLLRRELAIDVDDARSLGRVLDYEDGLVGVRGTWTEERRGRAVKEERYCPGARELARCPQVCTSLMMAMEAGTFSVIQPGLAVPRITKLLSRGDDCCLAVIELPEAAEPEAPSPQATPGRFPPDLQVPRLKARLAVAGSFSVIKACARVALRGTDQPMHWYEFFRYQPD